MNNSNDLLLHLSRRKLPLDLVDEPQIDQLTALRDAGLVAALMLRVATQGGAERVRIGRCLALTPAGRQAISAA